MRSRSERGAASSFFGPAQPIRRARKSPSAVVRREERLDLGPEARPAGAARGEERRACRGVSVRRFGKDGLEVGEFSTR